MSSVLIVGGTGFLGAWTTRAAVDAVCKVTLLNRGRTPAELPPVEVLRADRNDNLAVLNDRSFDVVIDTIAYQPAQVRHLLQALEDRFHHYVLVSTISACDLSRDALKEGDPPLAPGPEDEGYGWDKARCERLVTDSLGYRACIVRPGLIGGPGDHTDRATYWARRAARGGPALAPGEPGDLLQLIDVRDLATFLVRVGLAREHGVLHGVGAAVPWGDFLHGVRSRMDTDVEWIWASGEVLTRHHLRPWTDLPAWVPSVGPLRAACAVERTATARASRPAMSLSVPSPLAASART